MGDQINIFLDKEEFEKKLKELDNYYELEELLYYLLFLMNFLQGRAIGLVHEYLIEYHGELLYTYKTIDSYLEFKNLILHVFNYLYYDEIIEFEENLKSDIAKDLFGYILKDWQEKMVLFIVERSILEEVFIPFSIIRNNFNLKRYKTKSDNREFISLREAIKEVTSKLNSLYKKSED